MLKQIASEWSAFNEKRSKADAELTSPLVSFRSAPPHQSIPCLPFS